MCQIFKIARVERCSILKDVVLMFDQMYLWKCEEHSVGEIRGANENNELCNGLLLFMIVLLLYDRFQSDPLEALRPIWANFFFI